jgi:biotin transporter BioY
MTWWHLQYFAVTMLGLILGISAAVVIFLTIGAYTRPYFEKRRSARQREKGVE